MIWQSFSQSSKLRYSPVPSFKTPHIPLSHLQVSLFNPQFWRQSSIFKNSPLLSPGSKHSFWIQLKLITSSSSHIPSLSISLSIINPSSHVSHIPSMYSQEESSIDANSSCVITYDVEEPHSTGISNTFELIGVEYYLTIE